MRLQRLPPSVKHAQESDVRTETFRIGRYLQQRCSTGLKQQSKQGSFVLPNQRDEPVRHAEDDVIVSHWQKLLLPRSKPLITYVGLTLWAMPVSTRVIRDGLMTAAVALIAMAAERSCAATRDGVQHLDLWPGQRLPKAIQKSTAAAMNDIGHLPGRPCHYSPLFVGSFSLWKLRIVI